MVSFCVSIRYFANAWYSTDLFAWNGPIVTEKVSLELFFPSMVMFVFTGFVSWICVQFPASVVVRFSYILYRK